MDKVLIIKIVFQSIVDNNVQVHWILNELVMGGMVLETNMTEIMLRIEEQNKIEKEEVRQKSNSMIIQTHENFSILSDSFEGYSEVRLVL